MINIFKQVFKTQLIIINIIIIITFLIFYGYSYIIYELGRMSAKQEFMGLLIQEESVTTDKISIEDLKNDLMLLK